MIVGQPIEPVPCPSCGDVHDSVSGPSSFRRDTPCLFLCINCGAINEYDPRTAGLTPTGSLDPGEVDPKDSDALVDAQARIRRRGLRRPRKPGYPKAGA